MYWKFLRAGSVSPFTGYPWPPPGTWTAPAAAEAGTDASEAGTEAAGGCASGFHACRLDDLPYWLMDDELWEVELAGPVTTLERKAVAARARLVRRVRAWHPGTAWLFAVDCVARTVGHAVVELRACGQDQSADRLAATADLATGRARALVPAERPDVAERPDGAERPDVTAGAAAPVDAAPDTAARGAALSTLAEVAEDLSTAAARAGRSAVSQLCGYAADAVVSAGADPSASVAFIAARAAGVRGARVHDTADPVAAERVWQARWLAGRLALREP